MTSDLLKQICWPYQPCYKMITACSTLVNNWEQAVRTHLVDKLRDFCACTLRTFSFISFKAHPKIHRRTRRFNHGINLSILTSNGCNCNVICRYCHGANNSHHFRIRISSTVTVQFRFLYIEISCEVVQSF